MSDGEKKLCGLDPIPHIAPSAKWTCTSHFYLGARGQAGIDKLIGAEGEVRPPKIQASRRLRYICFPFCC